MDSGDGYIAFREMAVKIADELERKAAEKKSAKRKPSPPHKEQSDD